MKEKEIIYNLTKLKMSKFETYKDRNWEFRWRLTTNWIIVWASSEWFHSENYCIENAKKVMNWLTEYFNNRNKLVNLLLPRKLNQN